MPASGAGQWRRPAAYLAACAGAAVTLGSMFLPWYVVHLRVVSYADLSEFVLLHVGGLHLSCEPRAGASCFVSARVGALAGGIADWRTLIAVGAAAILLYLGLRAMNAGRAAGLAREWRVVTVLAAVTGLLAAAGLVVNPLTVPAGATGPGLNASLSYGGIVGLAGALAAVAGGLALRRSPG